MKLSKYCLLYPNGDEPDSVILFSTKKASAVLVDKTILTDIENGVIDSEERESLTDLGFLVDNYDEERQEVLHYIDELNEIDTKLSVIVAVNLDCNLACTYCFEGSRKGKHYMSPETARHVIDFIEKNLNDGMELLNVTFYGGEPLLSAELIVSMARQLKGAAEKKGIEFSFQFVTNGTLLNPSIVNKLKPLGLKEASITLDGPAVIHNLSRPFKSGAGSFDNILGNIKAVCRMIHINIGGNFTEANYREFPKLLDYLIAEGITPEKITSVKFDPVFGETAEYAPPEMTGACLTPNEPWIFDAGIFLRGEIMKRGFRTGGIQPVVCAIDLKNRHVINYDGNIYKCTGFFDRTDFLTGNVKNGLHDNGNIYNLDNWKNEDCLSCKYLPLCFGGCRYMKLVREGDVKGVDCKKPYYDACLHALVMQDLSMAG
ncbi:MAG TPA: geopeptide radical SAM maturase [Dissulfurispiraceae bacterium]|nr:geopeptide radical SAM maturase [Dissulfurispiraceae bacterium]